MLLKPIGFLKGAGGAPPSGITKVSEGTHVIEDTNASFDVTLPTSLEDDVIIVAMACSKPIIAINSSGWISLHSDNPPEHRLAYKVMGATPDTIIAIQGQRRHETCVVMQVWRGVDTTTPIDATEQLDSGSSGMPAPPNYTTVTNSALLIVCGALDDINIASSVTAPSGYSNLLTEDAPVGDGSTIMLASKIVSTAGSETPNAFGGGGSDDWLATTFALRPA